MKKSRSFSQSTLFSPAIFSKISEFKDKFNQSQQKFNANSVHNKSLSKMPSIASNILRNSSRESTKRNTPSINEKKSSQKQILNILIDSNELNPEKRFTVLNMKESILLQDLDSKAMEITRYTEKNSALLNQKENLENKIANLKKQIAEEQKRLSDARISCGNLRNEVELTQQRFEEKSTLKKELIKKCNETSRDNNNLTRDLKHAQEESSYNNKHINLLNDEITTLLNKISNTNSMLSDEESKRLATKENLILELKVMENDAILYKELVSQKEHLKSQIDKAFNDNMMQSDRKDFGRSRLSVNSNKK